MSQQLLEGLRFELPETEQHYCLSIQRALVEGRVLQCLHMGVVSICSPVLVLYYASIGIFDLGLV
jgi:hypothetical protein